MSDTATSTVQAPREQLDEPELRLFRGTPTLTSVTDKVSQIVEGPPPRWWWIAFAFSLSLLGLGVFAATYLISTGVGVWGLNQPVGWAFDITNFVFWVGILFEVMILFAALATVGGLLKLTGLPFFGHPLLKTSAFRRVTSDGFFLFVDARDDQFDILETRRALDALGGLQLQPVEA